MKTSFYQFRQNNSGGSIIRNEDEGIDVVMIIEATDANHANSIAEYLGLYFEGCNKDIDCKCCGDRWYRVDESDGEDVPCLYGEPLETAEKSWFYDFVFVHYLGKPFEKVELKEPKTIAI